MTPLEKAKKEDGRINYCDECEHFQIVKNAAYCEVDGKLIHPIMMVRGQGTGPAWNCKKRMKPTTYYALLVRKTPDEMAEFMNKVETDGRCGNLKGKNGWLDWLKQEVSE